MSFKDILGSFFKRTKKPIPPTTRTQPGGSVTFGAKGLNPGIEAGIGLGSDPLAIYRTNPSKSIQPDKAMLSYNSWVFACVKAIADELANMRFRMYRIKKDGTQEEVFEHDLLDLLDSVNEFQTGPELKHIIASHLEMTGNAYILMDGVKSEKDRPTSLFALNPGAVKVILDKTAFPYRIMKYEYRIDNSKFTYEPYQILHIKYPDPNDPYQGIGTVQTIAAWIDIDNYATEYNRKFFLNGATIGGFLESEATSEAAINALRMSFESNHGGVENSHKTGVLPRGVKYSPNQETHKDMDFANLDTVYRDKILAGFRVSKTILGTAESDTNRATAETADYIFARRTIKPKMELICSYINEFLTPRYGDESIYISFVDPTPEDKAFRIQEMQATVGNQPVLSVNEAREKYLNEVPVDNGDFVQQANSLIPVGKPGDKNGAPKKGVNQKKFARPVKTRFVRNAELRKKASELFVEKVGEYIKNLNDIRAKKWKNLTDDEMYTIWKEFAARVDVYEKKTIEEIKNINRRQKDEVLNILPDLYRREVKAIKPKDLFSLKGWIKITADALSPIMIELYGKESRAAGSSLGFTGEDLTKDPKVVAAVRRATELMSESYNQTTLDLLSQKLNEIIAAGATLDEAAEMVRSVYEFSDLSRSAAVARTETFRIANDATKEAWKATGVVKTIKWYTAKDDGVCAFCAAQSGKTISIDSNFYDEGDEVKGTDDTKMTVDYSDVGAPPLHVSCRCYISPDEISIE